MVSRMTPRAPSPTTAPGVCLDVHGVTVRLLGDGAGATAQVGRDFAAFRTEGLTGGADVTVRCHGSPPPWDDLPRGIAVLVQPHFVAYRAGTERWVDYNGQALTRWDFSREEGDLWAEDPARAWEVLYLLVHSRVGELLDRRGLHRLHALSLEVGGRAVLALLPSGGGKTTLGLAALELPGVRLLSDDIALVDRAGRVLPFPLRIGCSAPPAWVKPRHLRRFSRHQYGDKWLLDVEALGDRVGDRLVLPSALVVGQRVLGGPPSLARAPRRSAAAPLAREMVAGLGLPQLVEYFLRLDPADPLRKAPLAASRALAAARLLARCPVYRITLGRDLEDNADCWRAFLRERMAS